MSDIQIEWLDDVSSDCETCGSSYAEGARVTIDGEVVFDLVPRAHCFGGDSWDRDLIYLMILEKLGHRVVAE